MTLLALGEAAAAREQWQKVLEIEPENVRAKMYLRMMANTASRPPPPAT